MRTEKQEIFELIRRFAAQNGGNAPGAQRFQSLTGIGKSQWYPKLWHRCGDAVREAGFHGNSMAQSIGHEPLIKKYIELIRELQRFPIEGDLVLKRSADRSFPHKDAFLHKLGGKGQRAAEILEFCRVHEGYEDVVPFCEAVASSITLEMDDAFLESAPVGYVYLLKHGTRREYKIGRTKNPLRREGEIGNRTA